MTNHRIPKLPRETKRLILLPPSPENTKKVQQAIEESFSDLHTWMIWAKKLQTFEETKAHLESAKAAFEAGEDFGIHAFDKRQAGSS